jgi:hypothetical protein
MRTERGKAMFNGSSAYDDSGSVSLGNSHANSTGPMGSGPRLFNPYPIEKYATA